ncbi:MAG: hypothetical protein OEZ34_11640 [Spirochaetia bacterium]|nr:hypothetical protein [Spirochaetia bacterium]
MRRIMNLGIAAGFAAAMMLSTTGISAQSYKLGDAEFAKQLCNSWNASKLPTILASKDKGGNNWIDIRVTKGVADGYQKIVSGRHDCKGWPKFELVIEKQDDGTAKCTSAGVYSGSKVTWQFLPSTDGWFEYAHSFGYMAFMVLTKNGFKGSMPVGHSNMKNFAIFFRMAGKLALQSDYKSGCNGIDLDDVEDARSDLKKKWGM